MLHSHAIYATRPAIPGPMRAYVHVYTYVYIHTYIRAHIRARTRTHVRLVKRREEGQSTAHGLLGQQGTAVLPVNVAYASISMPVDVFRFSAALFYTLEPNLYKRKLHSGTSSRDPATHNNLLRSVAREEHGATVIRQRQRIVRRVGGDAIGPHYCARRGV